MPRPSPEQLWRQLQQPYKDNARIIANHFKINPVSLMNRDRGSPTESLARQVLMYLLHKHHGLDYTSTGLLLGRDRTTVAHGVNRIGLIRKFDMRDSGLSKFLTGMAW